MDILQKEVNDCKLKIEKLEVEVSEKESEASSKSREITAVKKLLSKEKEASEELRSDLKTSKLKISDLETRLHEKHLELSEAQRSSIERETEVMRLKEELKVKDSHQNRLNARLKEMGEERALLVNENLSIRPPKLNSKCCHLDSEKFPRASQNGVRSHKVSARVGRNDKCIAKLESRESRTSVQGAFFP